MDIRREIKHLVCGEGYNIRMIDDGHEVDTSVMPADGFSGWVLYDDLCGFCRRWVPMFKKSLAKRRIGVLPSRTEWVGRALGLEPGQTPGDICLLLRDGQTHMGPQAYRYAMRRIWWAYPIYLLSVIPIGRWCFDQGYKTFARNRYRFSKACGLPGADRLSASEGGDT